MGIENLMDLSNIKWIKDSGPDSDIVISSRIRLARNLTNIPFPHLLTDTEAKNIVKSAGNALLANSALNESAELYTMSSLSQDQRAMLAELHLISPELSTSEKGAVIVNDDETISVMINEEDHLRIQTVFPGLQLENTYDLANKIDDLLEEKLDFAFDETLGYLTACPTNVGTGIRASVMLHLPVLTMTEQLGKIFSTISQVGVVVRGIYGEGSKAAGNLYQISNQITLGKTEEDIIQNVSSVARQIIESERTVRKGLTKAAKLRLEDKIRRSYGILTNAKLITSKEAMALLSDVRLGIDMGILEGLDLEKVNGLFISTGPAYINEMSKSQLSPIKRDLKRADFLRRKLKVR